MKPHDHGHYKDGHSVVAFCKLCGAEGLALLDDCPKEVVHTFTAKAIDSNKPTDK